MKVAMDLDNCVLDVTQSAHRAIAAELGVPVEEVINTGIYNATFTHADPALAARIVLDHDFWRRRDVLDGVPPMPGAVEALWRLHDAGVLVSYVTRRAPESAELTLASLRAAGCPDVPVHFVGGSSSETAFATCKSEACCLDGATVLLDDSIDEARTALSAGIRVILLDPPVGRVARHAFLAANPHIEHCHDLAAAVERLLG